jgi:hypothetical protein
MHSMVPTITPAAAAAAVHHVRHLCGGRLIVCDPLSHTHAYHSCCCCCFTCLPCQVLIVLVRGGFLVSLSYT